MPSMRVLIFGVRSLQSGGFRVENEPAEAKIAQDVMHQLSERLGVEFVREDFPELRKYDIEPFRMYENGVPNGLVGMYVERDGKHYFPREGQDFVLLESDTVVVSSLA